MRAGGRGHVCARLREAATCGAILILTSGRDIDIRSTPHSIQHHSTPAGMWSPQASVVPVIRHLLTSDARAAIHSRTVTTMRMQGR
jgi:hypothetical protein